MSPKCLRNAGYKLSQISSQCRYNNNNVSLPPKGLKNGGNRSFVSRSFCDTEDPTGTASSASATASWFDLLLLIFKSNTKLDHFHIIKIMSKLLNELDFYAVMFYKKVLFYCFRLMNVWPSSVWDQVVLKIILDPYHCDKWLTIIYYIRVCYVVHSNINMCLFKFGLIHSSSY